MNNKYVAFEAAQGHGIAEVTRLFKREIVSGGLTKVAAERYADKLNEAQGKQDEEIRYGKE